MTRRECWLRGARAQAPTQGGKTTHAGKAFPWEGAAVGLAALGVGAGGCAYVWGRFDALRLELKNDLKPLASLSTDVAIIQKTLKAQQKMLNAQQETLKAQQEMLKAQKEMLKAQLAKTNFTLVLGVLGLLGTATVLYTKK